MEYGASKIPMLYNIYLNLVYKGYQVLEPLDNFVYHLTMQYSTSIYLVPVTRKHIQSVTKIYIYLFLKYVFFANISGTTWAIKKFLHLFASLSEEVSDEIWSQNQLIFAKTLFCQKKVSYWKKSDILKNSITFFHGSKV